MFPLLAAVKNGNSEDQSKEPFVLRIEFHLAPSLTVAMPS
jgi:hypothetical protein